jgi:hypothetical protein
MAPPIIPSILSFFMIDILVMSGLRDGNPRRHMQQAAGDPDGGGIGVGRPIYFVSILEV